MERPNYYHIFAISILFLVMLSSGVLAQDLSVQQIREPNWKIVSATGDYEVKIEDTRIKETTIEFCFTGNEKDAPEEIRIETKEETTTKDRTITKEETISKEEKRMEETKDGKSEYCYTKEVIGETYLKVNPIVVYEPDLTITYQEGFLQVNNTLKKWNGIEYVTAPNDIWITTNSGLKFGANDYVATEDTQYIYELTSTNSFWQLDSTKWVVTKKKDGYQVVDFADVCAYAGCHYEQPQNNKLLVYFTGEYISGEGISIDPTYTLVPVSANLFNNTRFENTYNTHLEINTTSFPNLTAYYSFDADNAVTNWVEGKVNNTLNFDGNTYTFADGVAPFNVTSFSFWFKPTATITTTSSAMNGISFGDETRLDFGSAGGACSGERIMFTNPVTEAECYTSANINTNWHHLAVSWNGSKYLMYLDGSLVSTVVGTGGAMPLVTNVQDYKIGTRFVPSATFNGLLDEVRIWDRSLSATEIANMFTNESNGITDPNMNRTGLQLEVTFNQTGDTRTAIDSSGNNRNSTISGSRINSVAYDLTNNNNDGTYTGDAYAGEGLYGKSLILNGDGDYVSLGNDLNPNLITISAWVNPKLDSTYRDLVSMGNAGTFRRFGFNGNRLEYAWSPSSNNFRYYQVNSSTTGGTDFQNDTWYHIAVTHNIGNAPSTTPSIYVNGVLVNSYLRASLGTGLKPSIQSLSIGRLGSVNDFYFNGSIDEVMLFNKILNATEVSQIYNNQSKRFISEGTVGFAPVGLNQSANAVNVSLNNFQNNFNTSVQARVGYWSVDDGYNVSGSLANGLVGYWTGDGNALDYSGNGNTGTLVGNANASSIGVFNNSFGLDGSGDYIVIPNVGFNTTQSWWYRNTTNNFVHYVNSSGTFYRNGVNISSANIIFVYNGTHIGRNSTGDVSGFIDDVMIWNRSLSADEVKEIYNRGSANWKYTDWVSVNETPFLLNTNNISDIYTSIRGELLLSTADNWYTPYVGDLILNTIRYPEVVFNFPETSIGTQAVSQNWINWSVNLTYATSHNITLYNNSGLISNSFTSNLSGSFESLPFGTYYLNSTAEFDGYTGQTNTITIELTPDNTPPTIENETVTPSSPEQYTINHVVNFTVDAFDLSPIDVYLQFNNTNYTMVNIGGNTYQYDLIDLPEGVYSYKFYAVDIWGNSANTSTFIYIITDTVSTTKRFNWNWDLSGYFSLFNIDKIFANTYYVQGQEGFTGNCVNTTYLKGIAVGCND